MDGMKDALLRMVRVARKAKELDEALLKMGYDETPYNDIYGEIAEAIYHLVGEDTKAIEESVTYTAITAPYLCDERRAAMLHHAYIRNCCPDFQPKQPKPNTIEPEAFRKMVKKNGGYQTPEGDWQ